MKKDITNTPSAYTRVTANYRYPNHESSVHKIPLEAKANLNGIFRTYAKPSLMTTADHLTLCWEKDVKNKSQVLTATGPFDSPCLPDSEFDVIWQRKDEDKELGSMSLNELRGVVRQFTNGYNPEGWAAQTFRKRVGGWLVSVDLADHKLTVSYYGTVIEKRTMPIYRNWDATLSSAEKLLNNVIRNYKVDQRLLQSAKDRKRHFNQLIMAMRDETNNAEGAEELTIIYQKLLNQDARVRKEFLKLVYRKGYRLHNATNSLFKI